MARSQLLDTVGESRRVTILHDEDGKQFIESRQDVDPIIRQCKILADQPPGKDFRHAAEIPEAVLNQAFIEGWFHDPKAWKKWANDPANECYRVWKGRL